jgi:hypothetical protein
VGLAHWLRVATVSVCAASAEQHAHYYKDECIVTATIAMITSFLSGATI